MKQPASAATLETNIAIHDAIAEKYDARHGEIFNSREQARLRASLATARDFVQGGSQEALRAFDFGCGSGNLTRHLLDLGMQVTAADVSEKFLALVRRKFATSGLTTLQLNGIDLQPIPDESYDLVATYSVLHHVPDYLAAVSEMARVVRPGGVIFIDHEQSPSFWRDDSVRDQYYRQGRPYNWRKWLVPSNYLHKAIRVFRPRHAQEGDIHVWPDDHIEWDQIEAVLTKRGFAICSRTDYLLFRAGDREGVYARFSQRCADMRCAVFRRLDHSAGAVG